MSKIIASAAIRGAHKIYARAEAKYNEAMEKFGPEQEVAFPETAYYLPIIFGILGIKVEKLSDMEEVFTIAKNLLPPPVREITPLPYLAPALDAGMATLFVEEMEQAIKYVEEPDYYLTGEGCDMDNNKIWLGAANDVILRKVKVFICLLTIFIFFFSCFFWVKTSFSISF